MLNEYRVLRISLLTSLLQHLCPIILRISFPLALSFSPSIGGGRQIFSCCLPLSSGPLWMFSSSGITSSRHSQDSDRLVSCYFEPEVLHVPSICRPCPATAPSPFDPPALPIQFEYQQAQLEAEIENLSWKVERADSYDRGVSTFCPIAGKERHSYY